MIYQVQKLKGLLNIKVEERPPFDIVIAKISQDECLN